MIKKVLGFFVLLTLCLSAQTALAGYSSVGPIPVPRIAQREKAVGGPGNDCYVCSLASVQAYYVGASNYSYGGYTRSYGKFGDYVWSTDPLWREIYALNGNSYWIAGTTCGNLPYPMTGGSYSVSNALSVIYAQLQRGNPVTVHACIDPDNGPMHASVIIGYKGNGASTLKTSDFIVMEIAQWNSNSYTGSINNQTLFNTCMTNPISATTASAAVAAWKKSNSTCYYTLQAWLLRAFASENINVNLRWVTNPPSASLKVYTEHAIEAMNVKLVENGSNRLVAYQYPYGASAEMTQTLSVGMTVRAVSSVYNSFNNLWYRTNQGRYVWSGITEFVCGVPNIKLSGFTLSDAYDAGTLPALSGTLTADSCITAVTASVHQGDASGEILQSATHLIEGLRTVSVSIGDTDLPGGIDLNALSGGTYSLIYTIAHGTHDETATLQYDFTVNGDGVTQITLSAPEEIRVGDVFALSASVLPEDASDQTLRFSSSDPSIASVDETGLVTTLRMGTVTLSALAASGASDTITIEIGHNIDSACILVEGRDCVPDYEAFVCNIGDVVPYRLAITYSNDYQAPYTVTFTSDMACVEFDEASKTFTAVCGGTDTLLALISAEINGSLLLQKEAVSCPVFVHRDERVFDLPASLVEVEPMAFWETDAYDVIVHDQAQLLDEDSFGSKVCTVYVTDSSKLTIEPAAFEMNISIVDLSPAPNAAFQRECDSMGYHYYFNGALEP